MKSLHSSWNDDAVRAMLTRALRANNTASCLKLHSQNKKSARVYSLHIQNKFQPQNAQIDMDSYLNCKEAGTELQRITEYVVMSKQCVSSWHQYEVSAITFSYVLWCTNVAVPRLPAYKSFTANKQIRIYFFYSMPELTHTRDHWDSTMGVCCSAYGQ